MGPMAIGGTLRDGTPGETGPVAGHSYVYNLASGSNFAFNGGVSVGTALNSIVDFQQYVYLSQTIMQKVQNGYGVWVVDQGGCYDESNAALQYWDLYDFVPQAQPSQLGGKRLVIFTGEGTVGIKGTVDNRQFGLSVWAPRAHLVIDESVGYVDGCIVAKSVTSTGSMGGANGAGVQIHCNCFDDASLANCPENGAAPPPPPCYDTLPQQKCMDLYQRGKCSRSKALNGCRYTCGWCGGCRAAASDLRRRLLRGGLRVAVPGQLILAHHEEGCTLSSHSHYKGLAIGGTLYDRHPCSSARQFQILCHRHWQCGTILQLG